MKKWWLIPVVIILVLLAVVGIFWNTISVYVAPKAALTVALTNTAEALQYRYESGPLPFLVSSLDAQGQNTVDLQLRRENSLLGPIDYDMRVQMEQNPRRIQADGRVKFQKTELDLSIYLDHQFAALSSAEVLQGKYYGLTYDSFADDVSNSTILRLLVDQNTLQKWQDSVSALADIMNKSISVPDFSHLDVSKLILGIVAAEVEVDREVLNQGEQQIRCFVISLEADGAQILQALDYLQTELPIDITPDCEISLSFWISEGVVRRAELEMDSQQNEQEIVVLLGQNPEKDDIQLLIQDKTGYQEIQISTVFDDLFYQETIEIQQVQRNLPSRQQIHYNWVPETGSVALALTNDNVLKETSFSLEALNNGFLLETQDFEGLMHLLIGTKDSGNSTCAMAVTKGANITTPEYKNFSQWSLEDMLHLASGLGGLFGIQLS